MANIEEAHWIPGDALDPPADTIQVMNFLNGQAAILNQDMANPKYNNWEFVPVVNTYSMIHSSRVVLCVLVAYLLSRMARLT